MAACLLGPDGALWFTENNAATVKVARITTAGVITEFPTGIAPGLCPALITTGPGGTFTEFPLPTANNFPGAIVMGPDGALWFTQSGTNSIGRAWLRCLSPSTLCIDDQPGDGRFEVEVQYHTSQGGGLSGSGNPISLSSLGILHGGLFWFFAADNPEMMIKVLDACTVNQKFWVYYSAGTNVGLTVTVMDTETGQSKVYKNADLTPAPPVQDVNALPCQ